MNGGKLLAIVRELSTICDNCVAKIAELEKSNAQLEARLGALEHRKVGRPRKEAHGDEVQRQRPVSPN